jgi:hypothetical protein
MVNQNSGKSSDVLHKVFRVLYGILAAAEQGRVNLDPGALIQIKTILGHLRQLNTDRALS